VVEAPITSAAAIEMDVKRMVISSCFEKQKQETLPSLGRVYIVPKGSSAWAEILKASAASLVSPKAEISMPML
jgi:hypothetical protein